MNDVTSRLQHYRRGQSGVLAGRHCCGQPPRAGVIAPDQAASILVGLLWCVALLSVVVFGVLHTARTDLSVTKNYGDRIQAHYLALAGIEKAKALLYRNAMERSRSGKNHTGELYQDPQLFRDVPLGRGQFSIVRRGRSDEGGGLLYGVADEESRLNVNTAATNELEQLDGMTEDVAAAIVDWRDSDSEVTPGGAEAEYYEALDPPYHPRNAPFETIRELLMVRGVSPELLLGRDFRQNGLIQGSDDPEAGFREDIADDQDEGWAGMLTADSSTRNVNAAGQDRVNIQTADETALGAVQGISPAIASAIVAYRGQNTLQSIADLLDVTAPQQQQNSTNQPSASSGGVPQAGAAPRVFSEDLLMDTADDLTVDSSQDIQGAVNINTAGVDVLRCLPGIDRELAQAIVSYRQSSGFFANIAWLLKVQGMTRETFKQVAPLVTARSETFRILSEGRINSTHTRQRIQVIVHVGLQDMTTLSYREENL